MRGPEGGRLYLHDIVPPIGTCTGTVRRAACCAVPPRTEMVFTFLSYVCAVYALREKIFLHQHRPMPVFWYYGSFN